jgi:3-hydroxymyristoyl/3-hydroxydecanoyl-(acyl carrier protein) dehydratase
MDRAEVFLPVGAMRQIDLILSMDGERIVWVQNLEEHWAFPLHFPGDPIFPGTLLIEGAGQTVGLWAWEHGLRGKPRLARTAAEFRSPLHPSTREITYAARVRGRGNIRIGEVEVLAEGRTVATFARRS